MKQAKPIVLFTTPVLHHPPVSGPYLRIENSIKALAHLSDLFIYSRVSKKGLGGRSGLTFYKQYCQDFYFAPFVTPANLPHRLVKKVVNLARVRILGQRIPGESEKDWQHLLNIADTIGADVIWLGYGNISYPLLKYIKTHSNYQVVLDTDSVWSRFILRGLRFAADAEEQQRIAKAGREKEEEERWGTPLADVTTAVSPLDAEYYCGLTQDTRRVHLFSNVIDMEAYQHAPPPAKNLKKPCLYLAGSFWPHSPMEDAARWMINQVLPLVRRQIPNVHFYIVGSGSERLLSDIEDKGITITGPLFSVLPHLCHMDVALVPLRYESGTRFKILEAGACGVPVVSTTLGAEGLPVTAGKDILIADEPAAFADAIVKLIRERDWAAGMAAQLKQLVQERYSISSLIQEGKCILEYLNVI